MKYDHDLSSLTFCERRRRRRRRIDAGHWTTEVEVVVVSW
jgi:hypothetical protein